jgi:uncharacterized sulfatase
MRFWLLILGVTLLAGCSTESTSPAQPENASPLNIVWLIAEDLSAIEIGSYGNAAAQTPILDRLALEGTRYSSAFATTPVCSPTRSSFITGMHNTTINAHNHRSHVGPKSPYQTGYTLPDPVKLLPQIFQEAGYTTAIWGKTDYNFNWTEGYDYDFQSETDGTAKGWDEVIKHEPFFIQVHFREDASRLGRQRAGYRQVADKDTPDLSGHARSSRSMGRLPG